MSQELKPGRPHLPEQKANGVLLAEDIIKATSAPPLPARR
jgi:hypothetical protein